MTTTSDPPISGRRPEAAVARSTDVSMLREALAALADVASPSAAARGRDVPRPECRTTRAALHDYLHERLVPSRRRRVEAHLDGCDECTRAFIDVREASWALRGLGRRLVADGDQGGRHRAPRRTATAARA